MAKGNRITATYKLAEHEFIQISVEADNAYPESLAVARANTRELMADVLADVMGNTTIGEVEVEVPMPDGGEAT